MIRIIVSRYDSICFNAQVKGKPATLRRGETKAEAVGKVASDVTEKWFNENNPRKKLRLEVDWQIIE